FVAVVASKATALTFCHLAARLFGPDRGKTVQARDAIAGDQFKSIALGNELVEGRLVLRWCHPVASLPSRNVGDFPEDSRVAVLRAVAVTADHDRLVALGGDTVEERLIVSGAQPMSGLPGGSARWLAPDGGIEILAPVEIAADPVEQVSLAREFVERSL